MKYMIYNIKRKFIEGEMCSSSLNEMKKKETTKEKCFILYFKYKINFPLAQLFG